MPLPQAREGVFSNSNDLVVASAARTATFASEGIVTGGNITGLVVEIRVTAASGTTPTLTVNLEDTLDGTNWNLVVAVNAAPITTTGTTIKRINLRDTPVGGSLRLNSVIAGTTPSFTYTARAYLIRD